MSLQHNSVAISARGFRDGPEKPPATKVSAPQPKQPPPAFDPKGFYVTEVSLAGTIYIQGSHVFGPGGRYLREAETPAVLSGVEARNFQREAIKQRQLSHRALEAQVPQQVLDAQRENAKALAAEEQAA